MASSWPFLLVTKKQRVMHQKLCLKRKVEKRGKITTLSIYGKVETLPRKNCLETLPNEVLKIFH